MLHAMRLILALSLALALNPVAPRSAAGQPAAGASRVERPYFPPKGEWEKREAAQVGMDPALLAAAVEWAKAQETDWPRDFSAQEETFGKPLGPVPTTRALTNGIILRRGYIIAEWGDTAAIDPTYSVAKSYLSTLAGLTLDRGLIPSVDDPVG